MMKKDNLPLKTIDLFAGVGGFRIGLNRVNNHYNKNIFKTIWANQWEPGIKKQHAAEIYRKFFNVSELEFKNVDIAKIKTEDIPDFDLMVGGFPCQDYSVAATTSYSKGIQGKKGVLWWQIERIIREKKNKPKYLLLENVDRLLNSPSSQRGRDFAIILTSLNQMGYLVEWRIIDASKYGFPQRRKRMFILGYSNQTSLYDKFTDGYDWLTKKSTFVKGFPIKDINEDEITILELPFAESNLEGYLKNILNISTSFGSKKRSMFKSFGVVYKNKVYTTKVSENYTNESMVLKDILVPENSVPKEYFISPTSLEKWKYLKGSKKEKRITKDGYEYSYSEGAISFPDNINKPSRTIITGEGGKSPSRFKHVIKTDSGKLRRLLPLELERLNMFPDNITEGYSDSKRAFIMGNALVVGVVEKIGKTLYENIKSSL